MEIKAEPNWGEKTGPFFHLQMPGEGPLGPFHGVQLKNYVEEVGLPDGTQVKDAKSTAAWQEIYTHHFFQRRRPQLLSTDNFEGSPETVYLLVDGQKQGPFQISEVHALIDEKEIILNDLVSFDEGHTWKKLYQYEDFDRRNHTQENLPESPGWEIFRESNQEIENELQNPNESQLETNAIAGLAFLENLKSGKTASIYNKSTLGFEEEEILEDEPISQNFQEEPQAKTIPFPDIKKEKKSEGPSPKTKMMYTLAIGFFLSTSAYFLLTKESQPERQLASETSQDAPSIEGQPLQKGKSGRARSNTYRSAIVKKKSNPRNRRPASITTTEAFQFKKKLQDDPYEYDTRDPYDDMVQSDQAYEYDQGETPVQQDPVRAKVDKNTIDPENNYYDSEEREVYDDNYNAQSEMLEDQPSIQPAEVWGDEPNAAPANEESFTQEDGDLYDEEAY
ncbi:unnamed protein product [Chrysoparadoxa australica]